MSDKKNIDRLFQEKFKDFEAEPNQQVWLNIEAKLKEKDRKVIPFWIQFSGIAAALILGLYAFNMAFNTNNEIKKTIVLDSKNETENKDSISKENNNAPFHIKNKQQLVISHPNTVRNHENKTFTSAKTNSEQKKNSTDSSLYKSKNNSPLNQTDSNTFNLKSDEGILEDSRTKNANLLTNRVDKVKGKDTLGNKSDSKIAVSDIIKQDAITPETPNALAEILKKKEEGKSQIELKNKDKWQIVPNVAAVYLNPNSAGSSIDAQFDDFTKTADNSLSFGIGVNYVISNKITLRTGLNKLALGYNTNDVVYSTSLATNNLSNINYSSSAPIEVKTQDALSTLVGFERTIQNTSTAAINQKMGYYEVPLELSYALLNKKFGVTIIGGISTLFLNQNKVSLISNNINLKLGEANNLNPIHFSTNVGMGFKYQFVKSFQVNIEPMAKYQLNTYSDNSNNDKAVFIGLYTGIIYSF
jgi:osmotically-inducible protein OsmY